MVSRRRALAAIGGALLFPSFAEAGDDRIAIIDWAALETALALGLVPVAATELKQYRRIAIEPVVPESVEDLGLRGTPNYELLSMLAPDLILSSNFYEAMRGNLERVAPVLSLPVYGTGESPYRRAEAVALVLGERLGRIDAAERLVSGGGDLLEGIRGDLDGRNGRPVFVISLGDARHFRAFGGDSMFGEVLERLGFRNAWKAGSRYSATAPVGIEALAEVPDAIVAIVGPVPPDARQALSGGAIWRALPMVRDRRILRLPPVNHFGGLPAALRFGRLFADAVLHV